LWIGFLERRINRAAGFIISDAAYFALWLNPWRNAQQREREGYGLAFSHLSNI
jgi:hypothetical protein